MHMDRRGVLASILAAVTTGVASGAIANPTKAMLGDPTIARYLKVIALQRKLYATSDMVRKIITKMRAKDAANGVHWSERWNYSKSDECKLVCRHADELLAYMHANFEAPVEPFDQEVRYQVNDLFEGRLKPDTMNVEGLQQLLEAVIPIAVVKRMVTTEKVPVAALVMTQFDVFANRYKYLIMDGSRRP